MPTGYTAGVEDGTVSDLRTFVLQCARAMGACVMQREDSVGVLPKLQTVSTYHREALEAATAKLKEAQGLSVEEGGRRADAEHVRACTSFEESRTRSQNIAYRYSDMTRQVKGWTPPTAEHAGLKQFMLDQLEESQRYSGHQSERPKALSGEAWLLRERAKAAEDIAYHTTKYAEEVERIEGANAWISALYASLEPAHG